MQFHKDNPLPTPRILSPEPKNPIVGDQWSLDCQSHVRNHLDGSQLVWSFNFSDPSRITIEKQKYYNSNNFRFKLSRKLIVRGILKSDEKSQFYCQMSKSKTKSSAANIILHHIRNHANEPFIGDIVWHGHEEIKVPLKRFQGKLIFTSFTLKKYF